MAAPGTPQTSGLTNLGRVGSVGTRRGRGPDRERRRVRSRSDSRSPPGWRRAWATPTAPSPLYRSYSRCRAMAHWLRACRSYLRCSGSIQCSIRFEMIRAFRNSLRLHQTRRINRPTRSRQQSRRRRTGNAAALDYGNRIAGSPSSKFPGRAGALNHAFKRTMVSRLHGRRAAARKAFFFVRD
jgi:hypothetical protein